MIAWKRMIEEIVICTDLLGKHSALFTSYESAPLTLPSILLGVTYNWGKGETKQRWNLEKIMFNLKVF